MPEHKLISHYQILSEAGRGGMATVYLAQDTQINRQVVIKVMPDYFGHDPQFRHRFLQEAQVMVTLSHPNIVPVYEYGEEGDLPYFVMGYMSNGSLADRIERGPISQDESIEILTPIASAIDYAHSKGIVHRDMKPANILFSESGASYLADFGIAKLAQATQNYTGSAIIGTPAYMSPEQVRGGQKIDGRSDIYSMGVILYEMLSGEVPYKADTPTQQLMMHVLAPIPAIRMVRPDVSPEAEAALIKALAKEPEQRYSSAREFVSALANPQGAYSPATQFTAMAAAGAGIDTMMEGKASPSASQSPAAALDGGPVPLPAVISGRKRSTTTLVIAGIVLIFLLIIAGGFFWFDRQTKSQALANAEIGGTATAAMAAAFADSDGDGLLNAGEQGSCTDPENPDSDSDGLSDKEELDGWQSKGINYTSDPCVADSDGDGLLDGEERRWATDPLLIDSDGDTLTDGDEINAIGSSPVNPDTDGDGSPDNVDPDPGQPSTIEETLAPSSTPTTKPTDTPLPPTDTPEPSPTPTPTSTPTPGLVKYTITVHTGCEFLAGTDANVYIILYGERAESDDYLLDNPGVNDHEDCSSQTFQFTMSDLGEINKVRIGHDNSGFAPGWFLNGVFIRNEATGEERYFSNNQWLATDEGDGRISRDLVFR